MKWLLKNTPLLQTCEKSTNKIKLCNFSKHIAHNILQCAYNYIPLHRIKKNQRK